MQQQQQDSIHDSKSMQQHPKDHPERERTKKDTQKKTIGNPLQQGIRRFLDEYSRKASSITRSPGFDLLGVNNDELTISPALLAGIPKRYTIYQPMLLLPCNVFTSPPVWSNLYLALRNEDRQQLFASIAESFGHSGVTHVAMNAPILLNNAYGGSNRMRSPTGLIPLYGDFGQLLDATQKPTPEDFEGAFWVQTTQNRGIVQSWAPLYTMFSRGNITEKARILGHEGQFAGLDETSPRGQKIDEISVVDLYAGIGYFVFSYLKRGVKRVWGWELNAWSVEGLRRGCLANGWKCKVVPLHIEEGEASYSLDDGSLGRLLDELTDDDRVIIFQGDNQTAPAIMEKLQPELERRGSWASVRHVNLGLLPTSRPTYETSLKLLDRKCGGWAHVHENVNVAEIESKKKNIVTEYAQLASQLAPQLTDIDVGKLSISCDHVERVKTYAPGVMHCVYDIDIHPRSEEEHISAN